MGSGEVGERHAYKSLILAEIRVPEVRTRIKKAERHKEIGLVLYLLLYLPLSSGGYTVRGGEDGFIKKVERRCGVWLLFDEVRPTFRRHVGTDDWSTCATVSYSSTRCLRLGVGILLD